MDEMTAHQERMLAFAKKKPQSATQEPARPDCNLVACLRIQKPGNFEFAVFQHGLAVAE